MDPNTTKETKILASNELRISKTYTLLIKDLPLVANLSKCYDKGMLNSSYTNSLHKWDIIKNDRDTDSNQVDKKGSDKPENSDNPFHCNVIKDNAKEDNALGENNCEPPHKHKQVDDKVTETMQAPLNYGDNGISRTFGRH